MLKLLLLQMVPIPLLILDSAAAYAGNDDDVPDDACVPADAIAGTAAAADSHSDADAFDADAVLVFLLTQMLLLLISYHVFQIGILLNIGLR